MTKIQLESVSATSKDGAKIDDVDLVINSGEYIAILGPTGSGPSELLKIIAGIIKIEKGRILFDDVDTTNFPPEDRNLGYVFEQFNLFPHLSVLDNLLFGPKMRNENLEQKTKVAEEIISMVRLNGREDAISKELSGGMQQRVGLARAIVAGAKVLLLDQPYRALDAKIRSEMRIEVKEIVKELGITCLHATHETEEAFLVADRIVIFNNGKIEQFGSQKDVFTHPKSEFVASFLAESNVWDVRVENKSIILPSGLKIQTETVLPSNKTKLVIRQHAIDLFRNISDIPKGWISLKGKIIKIRLLGQFYRFSVQVENEIILAKELLRPDMKTPFDLLNQEITIAFSEDKLKLF